VVLFLLSVILWGIDWVLISTNHSIEGLVGMKFSALLNDFSFSCLVLAIYFPIHFLFSMLGKRVLNITSTIYFSSFFIWSLALSLYFKNALIPLRIENLNGMSAQQVTEIIQIYGFSKWQLFFLFPILLIIYFMIRKSNRIKLKIAHLVVWPILFISII